MSSRTPPAESGVQWFEVDETSAGQRIDNYLLRELKGVPRSLVYRIIRSGEVRVNKGRCRADRRLESGDRIRVPPLRLAGKGGAVLPVVAKLEYVERAVLFEDSDLIVLNKPSGLAVHGGSAVQYGVIEALRQLRPRSKFLELVHRLDRDTSGVLLVAKRRAALLAAQDLFRSCRVEKVYHAWVSGTWPDSVAEVTAPLVRDQLRGGERIVRVAAGGKPSETRFHVLLRREGHTLMEVRPKTGRTHQIRVHAAYAGHPVLGDTRYASKADLELARRLGVARLCLHARRLTLHWPERAPQSFSAEWSLDDACAAPTAVML